MVFSVTPQVDSIKLAADVPFQKWQAVIHAPEGRGDRQVKVVDIGTSHVAVGVLTRDPIVAPENPLRGIVRRWIRSLFHYLWIRRPGNERNQSSRNHTPASRDIVTDLVGDSFSTSLARGDSQARSASEEDIRKCNLELWLALATVEPKHG